MTTQSTSLRSADILCRAPYVWPGGYSRYALLDDGSALCAACCRSNRELIGTTTGHDGWCIVDLPVNRTNPSLHCCNCNAPLQSAYGNHPLPAAAASHL